MHLERGRRLSFSTIFTLHFDSTGDEIVLRTLDGQTASAAFDGSTLRAEVQRSNLFDDRLRDRLRSTAAFAIRLGGSCASQLYTIRVTRIRR